MTIGSGHLAFHSCTSRDVKIWLATSTWWCDLSISCDIQLSFAFLTPFTDSKMSEVGLADEDGVAIGKRSASPPGRESREDWRGGEWSRNKDPGSQGAIRSRSRSRSPHRWRNAMREKQTRYEREGTNTTSLEPHMQRARLFVGNIDHQRCQRRDIVRLFSNYGEVHGVSVHKGYAFVQMDREKSANKAINFEDNRMFMGSRLRKF